MTGHDPLVSTAKYLHTYSLLTQAKYLLQKTDCHKKVFEFTPSAVSVQAQNIVSSANCLNRPIYKPKFHFALQRVDSQSDRRYLQKPKSLSVVCIVISTGPKTRGFKPSRGRQKSLARLPSDGK